MVDPAFIARMEYELKQNSYKGIWDNWYPTQLQLIAELLHHTAKLSTVLNSEDKHLAGEYSADIANIAMKAHELFGK